MPKRLTNMFTVGTIVIGALLLPPLAVPNAFRAESFEACFEDPSLKSKLSFQDATIIVNAHKNLPASSINILVVDIFGKWEFHKILPRNTSYVLKTFVGAQFVARMGNNCEYFSATQPFGVVTFGEFLN